MKEYEAMIRETAVERTELSNRIDELTQRIDALAPDADLLDRLERSLDGASSPEEIIVLLERLLRRVVVSKEEITVEPWRGTTWVYDRTPRSRSA